MMTPPRAVVRRRARLWGGRVPGSARRVLPWTDVARRWRRPRRPRDADVLDGLPEVLGSGARGALAGLSLVEALRVAASGPGAAAGELATVLEAHDRGLDLDTALRRWVEQRPLGEIRLLAAQLAAVATVGGSVADALTRTADVVRDRLRLRREASVQAAQARISTVVVGLAPLGFALLAVAGGEGGTGGVLLGTPFGRAVLAVGIGLDLVGIGWMRRQVAWSQR